MNEMGLEGRFPSIGRRHDGRSEPESAVTTGIVVRLTVSVTFLGYGDA